MSNNESKFIAEVRLSELIWRTIKLRISFLVLLLLGLILLLAGMEKANIEVQQIDTDFCKEILTESGSAKNSAINPEVLCAPGSARLYIEASIRIYRLFETPDVSGTVGSKAFENFRKLVAEYSPYIVRRKAAFVMQIAPPYAGGPVSVNALPLADLSPFCVLIVLSIVLALGYQQKCYEKILTATLQKEESDVERSLGLSLTQFFAGRLEKREGSGGTTLIYKRPIAIFPETLVSGTLLCAAVLLTLRVIADYNPTSIHSTNSIFLSYYFIVYCSAAILFGLLLKTHRLYAEMVAQRIGSPVRSARLFWVHETWETALIYLESQRVYGVRLITILDAAVSLLCFTCLFLSWTQPRELSGYQFLVPQKPIPKLMVGGSITLPTNYPIDPHVFREIRIQVIVALLFLLACFAHVILNIVKTKRFQKISLKARMWLGYFVAFLAANYLFYMAVLLYESESPDSGSLMEYFLNFRSAGPRGAPMIAYDPAFGFGGFILFCMILVVFTEVHRQRELQQSSNP